MKQTKRRIAVMLVSMTVMGLALSGCSMDELRAGFLPGAPGVTDHTDGVRELWNNAWIILIVIGLIVWGLIIWCVVVYRRRKGDTSLPAQMRYNMPIEIFYTIVPFVLIIGFFAATAATQTTIEARADEGEEVVTIGVVGQQWSWTFNYLDSNVYDYGVHADYSGGDSYDESQLPTLWLPVGEKVELQLTARDVAHSFWVPDFLYKKDTIPGRTNYMTFTPQVEGTYRGKCAELCGEYHSMMLFNVKVVSGDEYDAHMADLEEQGNIGVLDDSYDRNQNQSVTDDSVTQG